MASEVKGLSRIDFYEKWRLEFKKNDIDATEPYNSLQIPIPTSDALVSPIPCYGRILCTYRNGTTILSDEYMMMTVVMSKPVKHMSIGRGQAVYEHTV